MATVQRVDASAQRTDFSHGAGRTLTDMFDRVPPHNMDAEKGVLGSMLLDPEVCDEVVSAIRKPDDFYSYAHQVIYRCLVDMHNDGKGVDVTLLAERLESQGEMESIGGLDYLANVVNSVPSAANALYYAQIVHDKATLRTMIHASTEILRDAYDASQETRELLSRAEERIFGILENDAVGELHVMQDILHEALDRIDKRLLKGIGGAPTGFADLDRMTGGLHESELVIIAGRPSMGKTALATSIAEHVAIVDNRPTLFVSLEMSRLELAERMLCSHGRINGHELRNGFISPLDRKKLIEASNRMSEAPLYIDDSPSRTVTEIAAGARRLKRKHGLALVVVDYLQLIEPDNSKDPRQEQVAKIARRLKGLARELKVPLICLAQLNRQAEAAKDNIPRLSHLRESGAIEQDADVVMFVHREEYYMTREEDKASVAGQADIILAKQRNGPTGEVKLAWLQNYTRFENLARQEQYDFN